jgi:hypothetical protein
MQQVVMADPAAEVARRKGRDAMDSLLDQLEALHMQDINLLPELAVEKIRKAGVALPEKRPMTVSAAIEAVWKAQEQFLRPGLDDKVKRKRRSKAEIAAAKGAEIPAKSF